MANEAIKTAAKEAGVKLWEVAAALGITDSALSRKFRYEFSEQERNKTLATIKRISALKKGKGSINDYHIESASVIHDTTTARICQEQEGETMCSICLQTPCAPGCPNAPEPPCPFTCAYCREGIAVGEQYFAFRAKRYHRECVEDMSPKEWAEEFDVDLEEKTADREDFE